MSLNNAMLINLIQLLPGVKVVIANPETKGQCADSHLGEVSDKKKSRRRF